jgi:hypothetical protein
VDTRTDSQNCGGCGKKCADVDGGSQTCRDGQCKLDCDPGLSQCGGSCINTASDENNCGGCGKKCNGGKKACVLGLCLKL